MRVPEQYSKAIIPFSLFDSDLLSGRAARGGGHDQGLLSLDLSKLYRILGDRPGRDGHAGQAVTFVTEAKKRLGWVATWRRTGHWPAEAEAELDRLEAVREAEAARDLAEMGTSAASGPEVTS